MKKLGLSVLLLAATPAARAQTTAPLPDSVQTFLDKSLTLLQTYSLERNTVNWPQLRQAVYQKAQGARTVRELLPLYPYLFEQLKDDHGWLTYQDKTYKWRNPARVPYANAVVKAELAKKPGIRVRLLPRGVGYILLPGNSAGGSLAQMQAAAQVVQDSLCRLPVAKVRAWIIDLRLNDGGAMAPMLAGLAPLIGEGHLGGFVDKDGKPDEQWYLRRQNFYLDSLKVTNLTERFAARPHQPVAVLLSGRTASSGEIVAISLRGRPLTRFFGEPTYGATTANQSYPISGGAYLTIAGLLETDRNGVVYKSSLVPDELITGGDDFTELAKDAKVVAAQKWLRTSPNRRK
ncbi:Peptidase family S41 [Hymenobacter daecheongensis DSM 21074]|uniref:Peptidase family S41 n=1 Tax=Hymenobacter daecheongensis DSM 21074 TaxID=1121955 RepID=A0A1M6EXK7_9BACT|nr:S41 family peptidase [Hymenobacter daecheongensis]SHI90162.1 Peptidase family S41 [Hymenobacter daecheongensis DSM 21074]